jgi:hypothetical protein
VLHPDFWDHEELAERSPWARLLFAFLVSGREANLVPGLVNLGMAGLVESSRIPAEHASAAMRELIDHGFAQVDEKKRLIRVPNGPKKNPPMNADMLSGWYRRWKALPESPLKAAHVASIRESLRASDEKKLAALVARFDETFGAETLVAPTVQARSGDGGQHGGQHSVSHRVDTVGGTNGIGMGKGIGNTHGIGTGMEDGVLRPRGVNVSSSKLHDAHLSAHAVERHLRAAVEQAGAQYVEPVESDWSHRALVELIARAGRAAIEGVMPAFAASLAAGAYRSDLGKAKSVKGLFVKATPVRARRPITDRRARRRSTAGWEKARADEQRAQRAIREGGTGGRTSPGLVRQLRRADAAARRARS